MAKTEKILGKNIDLERFATRIENYLTENKFEVGFSRDVSGESHTYLIQARKAGILRTASGARRSTDITLSGTPNSFDISIGTGEWGKNLATSAPLFVIPVVGIAATITKLYTAKKFEDNLNSYLKDQVKHLQDTHVKGQSNNLKEYPCDYVEDYPGWNQPVFDGKLILERRKDQSYVVFKMTHDKEVKIPAQKIEKAEIVTKKTKFEKPDRMIRITFRDHDKTYKPIFNFNDDVIRGVLAGIDELVSETKLDKIPLVKS
ncbi:MAG: hypothetical protein ACE5RR_02255 [Nitrosarchaeum sp.]